MGETSIIEAQLAADTAGWRLDRALAAALPLLSRERLKALISAGAVTGPEGVARGGDAREGRVSSQPMALFLFALK